MASGDFELPISIYITNPKPVEKTRGPYANTAAAIAAVPQAVRHDGLIVKIIGDGEWWWEHPDLSDAGLHKMESGGGSGTVTKQVGTITGDGVAFEFPVAHTFGNDEISDIVKDSSGVRQYPLADYGTTNITYRFAVPPANGETFSVVMFGAVTGGGGVPSGSALDIDGSSELDIDGSFVLDVL